MVIFTTRETTWFEVVWCGGVIRIDKVPSVTLIKKLKEKCTTLLDLYGLAKKCIHGQFMQGTTLPISDSELMSDV